MELEAVGIAVNEMWIVLAAVLVMFMQAGFALVEAGFTRAKNAGNIIMKNVMDFSVGGLVYWAFGFALAYGGSSVGGFFAYGELLLQRQRDGSSGSSRSCSPRPRQRSSRARWPVASSSSPT